MPTNVYSDCTPWYETLRGIPYPNKEQQNSQAKAYSNYRTTEQQKSQAKAYPNYRTTEPYLHYLYYSLDTASSFYLHALSACAQRIHSAEFRLQQENQMSYRNSLSALNIVTLNAFTLLPQIMGLHRAALLSTSCVGHNRGDGKETGCRMTYLACRGWVHHTNSGHSDSPFFSTKWRGAHGYQPTTTTTTRRPSGARGVGG